MKTIISLLTNMPAVLFYGTIGVLIVYSFLCDKRRKNDDEWGDELEDEK